MGLSTSDLGFLVVWPNGAIAVARGIAVPEGTTLVDGLLPMQPESTPEPPVIDGVTWVATATTNTVTLTGLGIDSSSPDVTGCAIQVDNTVAPLVATFTEPNATSVEVGPGDHVVSCWICDSHSQRSQRFDHAISVRPAQLFGLDATSVEYLAGTRWRVTYDAIAATTDFVPVGGAALAVDAGVLSATGGAATLRGCMWVVPVTEADVTVRIRRGAGGVQAVQVFTGLADDFAGATYQPNPCIGETHLWPSLGRTHVVDGAEQTPSGETEGVEANTWFNAHVAVDATNLTATWSLNGTTRQIAHASESLTGLVGFFAYEGTIDIGPTEGTPAIVIEGGFPWA